MLFGLYDENLELMAPYFSDANTMECFESRARKHEIGRLGYFAVKTSIAKPLTS